MVFDKHFFNNSYSKRHFDNCKFYINKTVYKCFSCAEEFEKRINNKKVTNVEIYGKMVTGILHERVCCPKCKSDKVKWINDRWVTPLQHQFELKYNDNKVALKKYNVYLIKGEILLLWQMYNNANFKSTRICFLISVILFLIALLFASFLTASALLMNCIVCYDILETKRRNIYQNRLHNGEYLISEAGMKYDSYDMDYANITHKNLTIIIKEVICFNWFKRQWRHTRFLNTPITKTF